jgi:hypothetical protein
MYTGGGRFRPYDIYCKCLKIDVIFFIFHEFSCLFDPSPKNEICCPCLPSHAPPPPLPSPPPRMAVWTLSLILHITIFTIFCQPYGPIWAHQRKFVDFGKSFEKTQRMSLNSDSPSYLKLFEDGT